MKRILTIFALTSLTSVNAQILEWAKSMGGTSNDFGVSIDIDDSGNSYIAGSFNGTVDFDPGVGINNLTSAGGVDIFVAKFDVSGNFVWAKAMGSMSDDYGYSIVVDASGNVYTTGDFMGTADFDPGVSTFSLTSAGNKDIFISKLDASGNFLWAKTLGGAGDDSGNSIAIDASGNVHTTGFFNSTSDFDPGVSTFSLTSAGNKDIFISKLDASGNFLWAKALGGAGDDAGYSIGLDASGNVHTTGFYQYTADFDPGVDAYDLTCTGQDIFISKLDASGNFVWAKTIGSIGSSSDDSGQSIAVDASGNVYTTGYFKNSGDFNPGAGTWNLESNGSQDIFISKLDASGNFLWAKAMGGTSNDFGQSIAVDASGNVYTTGRFAFTADFDPGVSTYDLVGSGSNDAFISKLDASGNFVWAIKTGGSGSDSGYSIAVDASENIYTTGGFSNTVDFDPNAGTFNLTSAGSFDIFVMKLSPAAPAVPEIVVGSAMSSFAQILGTPSAEQSFTVSGSDLTNNITVTAPTNYEVSLTSGSGFASSVQVNQTSGSVPTTTIYVRLNAGAVGAHNGDITVTSGVLSETLALNGNTIDNSASLTVNGMNHLLVYPNPVSDIVTIKTSQPTTALFMGANGSILTNLELNGETAIDVSSYAPGVYFIRTAEGQTVKFIKQ
jgi:hypothetical protein